MPLSVLGLSQGLLASVSDNIVICKNDKKQVRTIKVKEVEDDYFVTLYMRDSVKQEVGRAKNRAVCLKIMSNITDNLKKAGWQCKEAMSFSETNLNIDPSSGSEAKIKSENH